MARKFTSLKHVRNLIGEDDLRTAYSSLEQYVTNKSKDIRDALLLQKSSFQSLEKEKLKGLIERQDYKTERDQIRGSILELIDRIEIAEHSAAKIILDGINRSSRLTLEEKNMVLKGTAVEIEVQGNADCVEIAIAIGISQPCKLAVDRFLAESEISATRFSVSLLESTQRLRGNQKERWESILKDLAGLIQGIRDNSTPQKTHFFLATPAALAMGIGAIIGTISNPYIYNFDRDRQTYDLVVVANEDLR